MAKGMPRTGQRLVVLVLAMSGLYTLFAAGAIIPYDIGPAYTTLPQMGGVQVAAALRPPDFGVNSPARLDAYYVTYSDELDPTEQAPTRWCVDTVWIFSGEFAGGPIGQKLLPGQSPMCGDLTSGIVYDESGQPKLMPTGRIDFENASSNLLTSGRSSYHNTFMYPYDSFEVRFAIRTEYNLVYTDGASSSDTSTAAIIYPPSTQDWKVRDLSPTAEDLAAFGQGGTVDEQEVHKYSFERPMLDQAMFPIIVLTILLFIVLLCFVESLATFIEGAVGVFFGIFGANQVLVPTSAGVRTIVHYANWGLYVALAVVVLAQLQLAFTQKSSYRVGRAKVRARQTESEMLKKAPIDEIVALPPPPSPARSPAVEVLARGYLVASAFPKLFKHRRSEQRKDTAWNSSSTQTKTISSRR